jgi:hypothetical protein
MHKMAPEMATRRHAAEAEQLRRAGELPRGVETGAFNPPPTPPTPGIPIDPRHATTPGFPSKPPFDPNEERKNKAQINPTIVRGTKFPAEAVSRPGIYIFPDLSDEVGQIFILKSGNERPETKKQIDELEKLLIGLNPEYEKDAGGRDANKKDVKEEYIGSPANDFEADGRLGSNRPDLTLKHKITERRVRIQTADVDRKTGKATARELDAALRIFRRTGEPVFVFLKSHQIKGRK